MRQNAMTASLATQVALGELGKLDSNDCAKPRTVDDVSSSSFTQRQFSSNLESLSLGDGRVKGDLPNEKSETPAKSENQRNTFQHLQNDMALAVSRLVFPGRQEWIDLSSVTGRKEQVLLDGAHNPQSAAVLKKKIAEMRSVAPDDEGLAGPPNPITWVVAMTRGKQVDDFFKELLDEGDNVVAVEFGPVDGMPWVEPTPAGELISAVRDVMPGLGTTRDCGKDLSSALETATKIAEDTHGQKLVIAGSLYLVGDTHRLLRKTSTPQFDVRRYDTRPGRRRAKR
jgi:folylpolyglutamate synthase